MRARVIPESVPKCRRNRRPGGSGIRTRDAESAAGISPADSKGSRNRLRSWRPSPPTSHRSAPSWRNEQVKAARRAPPEAASGLDLIVPPGHLARAPAPSKVFRRNSRPTSPSRTWRPSRSAGGRFCPSSDGGSAFVAFAVAPMFPGRSMGSRRSGGNRGSLSGVKRRAR